MSLSDHTQTQKKTNVSYKSNRTFLEKIDTLPTHGPQWTCDIIDSPGDRLDEDGKPMAPEELELWHRDPIECVQELLSNPAFVNHLKFGPERVYLDERRTNRHYDEMWTADWWWIKQVGIVLTLVSS